VSEDSKDDTALNHACNSLGIRLNCLVRITYCCNYCYCNCFLLVLYAYWLIYIQCVLLSCPGEVVFRHDSFCFSKVMGKHSYWGSCCQKKRSD